VGGAVTGALVGPGVDGALVGAGVAAPAATPPDPEPPGADGEAVAETPPVAPDSVPPGVAAPAATGKPVVGVTTAFGSGAGGAPDGGRVEPGVPAAAVTDGTTPGTGGVEAVATVPEKITATRPIVAAAAPMPVNPRAVAAGWCRPNRPAGARSTELRRAARSIRRSSVMGNRSSSSRDRAVRCDGYRQKGALHFNWTCALRDSPDGSEPA
jgi:hypothetical protein